MAFDMREKTALSDTNEQKNLLVSKKKKKFQTSIKAQSYERATEHKTL